MVGIYKSNNRVAIVYPNIQYAAQLSIDSEITLNEALIDILRDSIPKGIDFLLIDQSELPSDEFWMDAWEMDGGKIYVDIEKAVLIVQDRIRIWREASFKETDVRIQNALADGNEDARLQAVMYRDYLRNLPQACIGKDLDGLKAIIDGVMSFQEYILMGGSGE